MADLPYMAFFVDAYWLDAGHLTEEEHGAYLRLLILAWGSPGCRLPNDDTWLARRLARPVEVIEKLYRPIIAEFWKSDGNWVWQKRQRAQFEYASKKSKSQSDKAKARWQKEKTKCHGNAGDGGVGNAGDGGVGNAGDGVLAMPLNLNLKEETPISTSESLSESTESDNAPSRKRANGAYRWEGRFIKLNEQDYERWRQNYYAIDLSSSLQSLDDIIGTFADGDRRRKDWFSFVSNSLRKRHEEALAAGKAATGPPPLTEGYGFGIIR